MPLEQCGGLVPEAEAERRCSEPGYGRRKHAPAQEHERAAGTWHAEWGALADALAFTGGAVSWLRQTLDGLEVDAERMRANIRPETLSEAERFGLAPATPDDYLGTANALVDRALAEYRGDA